MAVKGRHFDASSKFSALHEEWQHAQKDARDEGLPSSENRGRNAATTGFPIPVTTGHGLEGFE